MTPVDLPLVRFGRPYTSADVRELRHPLSGELLARVSLANPALIRRDARSAGALARRLRELPTARLLAAATEAAERFTADALPLFPDGPALSFDDHLRLLSATTGLPLTLCRQHMAKLTTVLGTLGDVLRGLTRGVDPAILDQGYGEQAGVPVSFVHAADSLAVVLPNNSPGVNTLWLPAVGLRTPVALKPGATDPWTPYRLVAALTAAGVPAEAFALYPAEHEGASAIVEAHDRAALFGDASTVARHGSDPTVEVHGPGYSKVLIGPDAIARWPELLDTLAASVVAGAGRSCINASTIVVPSEADALADALAARLSRMVPRPADADDACLAGWLDGRVADALNARIDAALAEGGARDVTADHRAKAGVESRRVDAHGLAWLLPTVVRCHDPAHPLARTEFPFPFVAVVELPPGERTEGDPDARCVEWMGETLVLSAITEDVDLRRAVLAAPSVRRLNLGAIPTTAVRWEQPHEGNLFELLVHRRAIAWESPS